MFDKNGFHVIHNHVQLGELIVQLNTPFVPFRQFDPTFAVTPTGRHTNDDLPPA